MNDLAIRAYHTSDMGEIVDLINVVQPHVPFTVERWRWEYANCLNGGGLAWVAEHAGKIICHLGVLRFNWYVDGKKTGAFQYVDAMTHPDFRFQKIFARVVATSQEHFERSGIPHIYYYPNENSMKESLNLGVHLVTRVPLLVRGTDGVAPVESVRGVRIEKVRRFDSEIERLCESMKEVFRFAMVRDPSYLTWRYLEKPDDSYVPYVAFKGGTLVGYMIFKVFEKHGETRRSHIVDLWAGPEDTDTMAALVRYAIRLASEAKAEELSCWMLPHAPAYAPLLENGFQTRTTDRYLVALGSKGWKDRDALQEPGNWHITMGDSDVF